MSKVKTAYFCSNCGYESAKWLGKCPSCNSWNTFVEEVISKGEDKNGTGWKDYTNEKRIQKTILLNKVNAREEDRLLTTDPELNRVLGGGIVPGSIVLVAGEPGIGKSTLFLQVGLRLNGISTLYISGKLQVQMYQVLLQIFQRLTRYKMF